MKHKRPSMKLVDYETEGQLTPKRAYELRKQVNELQSKVNDLNFEIENLLKELTSGISKIKIQVCEEETENSYIGWYDGKVIYRKPKALQQVVKAEESIQQKQQPHANPQVSSNPPEEAEVAEGPVFLPDEETFEAESLI